MRWDWGPWQRMSPLGLNFVKRCLERDPAARMTVEEALAHPWLAVQMADGAQHAGCAAPASSIVTAPGLSVVVAPALHQQQRRSDSRRGAAVAA
jgi:hypothetical protein